MLHNSNHLFKTELMRSLEPALYDIVILTGIVMLTVVSLIVVWMIFDTDGLD